MRALPPARTTDELMPHHDARRALRTLLCVIGASVCLTLPAGATGATTRPDTHPATKSAPARATPEPGTTVDREGPDDEPTTVVPTTSEPEQPTTSEHQPTTSTGTTAAHPTTSRPDERPTTTSHAATVPADRTPTTIAEEPEPEPTTSVATVRRTPGRPSASPRVRDSHIPIGSIALSLAVLFAVGLGSFRLIRRPATTDTDDDTVPGDTTVDDTTVDDTTVDDTIVRATPPEDRGIDPATADFLVALGEALMDAGSSVGHVEASLRSVARVAGTSHIGVVVLPTALIVSVADGEDLVTELGAPGRDPLRFDQVEDVLCLLDEAETGKIGPTEGKRRLAAIRSAPAPYRSGLIVLGNAFTAIGLAAILHGTWIEIPLAAILGAAVGALILWTRRLSASYRPFVILLAATVLSATVFALTRAIGDLLTLPLLMAPLIAFLPGGLLTIAILELATGQIISGASRLASGGLQLILLAIGLVAGAQLVGVPSPELSAAAQGSVAAYVPWIGVAAYGIGVVWFQGARPAALGWMLVVMYVAYAGQVLGGLFFGSSLSAFFGALALTPVAVLVARRAHAPSPLVMILPAFWLLVPGALGLTGVTALFGAGGIDASGVLVTTITSMVGVSLGILLGLLVSTSDPERPLSNAQVRRTHESQSNPQTPDDDD